MVSFRNASLGTNLNTEAVSSKFISNFQVQFGAATNYSVVPAAFNSAQFSRQELLTNIADIC